MALPAMTAFVSRISLIGERMSLRIDLYWIDYPTPCCSLQWDLHVYGCQMSFLTASYIVVLLESVAGYRSPLDRYLSLLLVPEFYLRREMDGYGGEASTTALPQEYSDHSPIVHCSSVADFGPPHFLCFNSSMLRANFNDVFLDAWISFVSFRSPDMYLAAKFRFLNTRLKKWRHGPHRPKLVSPLFKTLYVENASFLEVPLDCDEIGAAISDCGNDKDPEPDGFIFKLLKTKRDVIKADIMAFVKHFDVFGTLGRGSATLTPDAANSSVNAIVDVGNHHGMPCILATDVTFVLLFHCHVAAGYHCCCRRRKGGCERRQPSNRHFFPIRQPQPPSWWMGVLISCCFWIWLAATISSPFAAASHHVEVVVGVNCGVYDDIFSGIYHPAAKVRSAGLQQYGVESTGLQQSEIRAKDLGGCLICLLYVLVDLHASTDQELVDITGNLSAAEDWVVLGPYYLKHKIHTRIGESLGESEKLQERFCDPVCGQRMFQLLQLSHWQVKGQQGRSQCSTYRTVHKGVCRSEGLGYFRVAGLIMSAEGD
uniref:Uncharacterized protein n=1 Tax=Lactuca sativa TaxID=4236 RepID=A0A9R1XMG7_LACSA|nr:hypothetical protein LSAT_V11C300145770 [Lactuca sativa]